MKIRKISFILLILICFAFCGCGEKENTATTELLPQDGILVCTIDNTPYYYNNEYLFKIINYDYPENPDESMIKHAILTELCYKEALETGKTVTDDFLEKELQEREASLQVAEESLADPSLEQEFVDRYTHYISLFNTLCEKENCTGEEFWENNINYVKKGCLSELYCMDMYNEFLEKSGKDYNAYNAYFLSDPDNLLEKYNVEILITFE